MPELSPAQVARMQYYNPSMIKPGWTSGSSNCHGGRVAQCEALRFQSEY